MPAGRVLVVDDHPALLLLTENFLGRLGYEVEGYTTAQAAWRRFCEQPERWSVVIADATLPDEPGVELVRKMLLAQPAMRAIVWSGYPIDRSVLAEWRGQVRALLKPVGIEALREALSFGTSAQP